MATAPVRPLRADARRNRDAILAAARAVFEADGIYAPIDAVAAQAGVGNATLYRNFPTRDDLLAAVIEDSIADLLRRSEALEALPADDALREWAFELGWALRVWQELPTCVAAAVDSDSPVEDVATRLTERTGRFLRRARRDGSVTTAVTARELFELITAVSWAVDRFGDGEHRARRRMALAVAGLFDAR